MAVAALSRREVNRIILTRPAVEAGERLGFLPGDIAGKGRPLPAPALRRPPRHARPREGRPAPGPRRDRGRAAGIHARPGAAARPPGPHAVPASRPIGSLRVGDLVIGSDGLPTPVLGVYPQGRQRGLPGERAGRRVDACAAREHLWFVTTPDDRQPRQARPRPSDAGDDRTAAPAPSASVRASARQQPVELEPQDVPMDPYALGLLLGDGCITTKTTPCSATEDPELAAGARGRASRYRAAAEGQVRLRPAPRRTAIEAA